MTYKPKHSQLKLSIMNTEIKLIVDTHNDVIRGTVDGTDLFTPYRFDPFTKQLNITEAKGQLFNEACRLTVEGHTITISENWF